jgi:predicted CXXCH cytochrome family protein
MSMRTANIVSRILPVLLLLMTAAIISCTITEKRYKTLKIFFDGVPDPNARAEKKEDESPKNKQPTDQNKKRPVQEWVKIESRHPDYYNRKCENCHNKSAANFLKTGREKFCFTCHDQSDFQGDFLHGPVAGNDCLVCHLPHQSRHKYLLKETGAGMCLECHMREDVALNPVHAGVDFEKGNCTQCHYPHAADSRFFLKNRGV